MLVNADIFLTKWIFHLQLLIQCDYNNVENNFDEMTCEYVLKKFFGNM